MQGLLAFSVAAIAIRGAQADLLTATADQRYVVADGTFRSRIEMNDGKSFETEGPGDDWHTLWQALSLLSESV